MSALAPSSCADALRPFVERGEFAGAVTLVASADGVLETGTIGHADLAARTPMRADTLFWVASHTKPMTCTALMMLVDEGKIRVDDPVEQYLPEFQGQMVVAERDDDHVVLRPPAHPITVREVLSHTSGLPFGLLIEPVPKRDLLPLWAAVRACAMVPLLFEPGTRYEYSNAGTNTVGRLVEVVSGVAYEDFMQTRLFDPLGMADTTFWPDEGQVGRLAKSYQTKDGATLQEVEVTQLTYPLPDRVRRFAVPGSGLISSAADCARFCRMMLRGGTLDGLRYVSKESVRLMTSRQTPPAVAESYGFGWSVNADGEGFGHSGAFSTDMHVDARRGLITVFLVQVPGNCMQVARDGFRRAAEERFGK